MIQQVIATLAEGKPVSGQMVEQSVEEVLAGQATPAQIGALLLGLRMAGETAEHLAAAARVTRAHAIAVLLPNSKGPILDTCGTGGDGHDTFNISTVSAIVLAACGVTVAKHGNRAASSRCGSADLLEALGINLDMPPAQVAACIEEVGVGFMFARSHHPAMRHAAPVRAELGIRTIFNLLGPLANPAGASHQLLGIGDATKRALLAEVLIDLQIQRAWVVTGAEGLDEVSLSGPTQVTEIDAGKQRELEVVPEDFGLTRAPLSALVGGDIEHNRGIALDILDGKAGPKRDAVVLNSAAALCVTGLAQSPLQGAELAAAALDSGRARQTLDRWVAFSRG